MAGSNVVVVSGSVVVASVVSCGLVLVVVLLTVAVVNDTVDSVVLSHVPHSTGQSLDTLFRTASFALEHFGNSASEHASGSRTPLQFAAVAVTDVSVAVTRVDVLVVDVAVAVVLDDCVVDVAVRVDMVEVAVFVWLVDVAVAVVDTQVPHRIGHVVGNSESGSVQKETGNPSQSSSSGFPLHFTIVVVVDAVVVVNAVAVPVVAVTVDVNVVGMHDPHVTGQVARICAPKSSSSSHEDLSPAHCTSSAFPLQTTVVLVADVVLIVLLVAVVVVPVLLVAVVTVVTVVFVAVTSVAVVLVAVPVVVVIVAVVAVVLVTVLTHVPQVTRHCVSAS